MGSVVADEGPTTYLLVFILFFRWDFSDPFDVCLGYPILRYPTVAPEPQGECVHSPGGLAEVCFIPAP